MKIYLVGGAIRDKLLGIPVKEKDWVVVGSYPDEMKAKGFKQVGKDFPVFIDPKTGEEYALARTERKSGHGYTGFKFDTNPNVTLEEDLERRDLTINAIAQDEDGTLIDPFNGQEDIKNKKLRHVSDAFSEDPLRVLRVARFQANLEGFVVVPETMDKLHEIVISGELEYLTPERKWLEFNKTRLKNYFFVFLKKINARDIIAPEWKRIGGESTILLHKCYYSPGNKAADPDKNEITATAWFIANYMTNIESFCKRFKVPNEYMDLAQLFRDCFEEVVSYSPRVTEKYDELLSLVKKLDIRKEERLKNFLEIAYAVDSSRSIFFNELILKIKSYKLKKEDQKKSNQEIQKIVENAHREIAQEHIRDYLNKND